MKIIKSNQAPAAIGPYAQAIKTGDWLFTSGQIPLDLNGDVVDGGIESQTHQVFANLSAVLKEANLDFSQVIKTTVFLADMSDFPAVNKIYSEYFLVHTPARSTVEVARLPRDVKIEIELIAHECAE